MWNPARSARFTAMMTMAIMALGESALADPEGHILRGPKHFSGGIHYDKGSTYYEGSNYGYPQHVYNNYRWFGYPRFHANRVAYHTQPPPSFGQTKYVHDYSYGMCPNCGGEDGGWAPPVGMTIGKDGRVIDFTAPTKAPAPAASPNAPGDSKPVDAKAVDAKPGDANPDAKDKTGDAK